MDINGKVVTVARAIIREVEDLEIDEDNLRLAMEYLVYAAMALRSVSRELINTTTGEELAEITSAIIEAEQDN
jgi:chromatin segregation and condensation protein Rec8/ScpA/Scc1 (kleisin family)